MTRTLRAREAAALLLGVLALVGCAMDEDERPLPGRSGTAELDVIGEGIFRGAFIVEVGPLEGVATFIFNGYAAEPTPEARSIGGNMSIVPGSLVRTAAGDSLEYAASDPWLWIFDNRGSVNVYGDAERNYKIRELSYRADPDRSITVRFVAIGTDRIDGTSRTILPGDDLVVQISGHWIGNCVAVDELGRVVNDPTMVLNPLCRELLGPVP